MSELALPTVVSDTMRQPSSKVQIFDGTFDGGFDVVKCSFSVMEYLDWSFMLKPEGV